MEPPQFNQQHNNSSIKSQSSTKKRLNPRNQNNNNNQNPLTNQPTQNNYDTGQSTTQNNNQSSSFPPNMQQPQQFYQPQSQTNETSANTGSTFMPGMNLGANMGGNNTMGQTMMANMAMNYGKDLTNQGSVMVGKYIDSQSLKLYFQVDTNYVQKKLFLLFLPFLHKDWSIRNKGSNTAPLSPRDDINVPDLYIPSMAIITYVLLSGIYLGRQNKFTPEALGTNLSYGMGWMVFEVLLVLFIMYLIDVRTDMKTYDIVSYLGYKFVPVCTLMCSLIVLPTVYWILFSITSGTCSFFIYKTLLLKISNPTVASEDYGSADKVKFSKKNYIIMVIAVAQPLLIYILTYSF